MGMHLAVDFQDEVCLKLHTGKRGEPDCYIFGSGLKLKYGDKTVVIARTRPAPCSLGIRPRGGGAGPVALGRSPMRTSGARRSRRRR